jgi:hypothetical protein
VGYWAYKRSSWTWALLEAAGRAGLGSLKAGFKDRYKHVLFSTSGMRLGFVLPRTLSLIFTTVLEEISSGAFNRIIFSFIHSIHFIDLSFSSVIQATHCCLNYLLLDKILVSFEFEYSCVTEI